MRGCVSGFDIRHTFLYLASHVQLIHDFVPTGVVRQVVDQLFSYFNIAQRASCTSPELMEQTVIRACPANIVGGVYDGLPPIPELCVKTPGTKL